MFYDSLTSNQKMYSMYFISRYESSSCWDATNYDLNSQYGDPFTLGIMQWAGTRAYQLLASMQSEYPDLYSAMPTSWKSAVDDGTSSAMWGGWSMDQGDVDTWRDAIASHLDDAKMLQERIWLDDLGDNESLRSELTTLDSWGTLPESPTIENIRVIYFYLARYHNTGYNMHKVYTECGWDASLEDVRDATIRLYRTYTQQFQGWYNAIEDNYETLKAWDGDTVPDFGQLSMYGGPSGTTSPNVPSVNVSGLRNIMTLGDDLVAHFDDGRAILCRSASAGHVWLPIASSGGVVTPQDDAPVSSGSGNDVLKNVIAFYENDEGKYGYTLDGDFLHPNISGESNCSAYIIYVGSTLYPDGHIAHGGTYTGTLIQQGDIIATGSGYDDFPYNLAQPLDCLFVNWYYYNATYDHVELYFGTESQGNDSGSELWGAGSAPLPHKSGYAGSYVGYTHDWALVRIPWDS